MSEPLETPTRVFSCEICEILRTPILKNIGVVRVSLLLTLNLLHTCLFGCLNKKCRILTEKER